MTRKFLKTIICSIAVLCLLGGSLTAFATNNDVDFDFNIQPIEPTTQATTVPIETEKETEKQTEKNTTEKQTTEKPTKKPTSAQTTKPKETQSSNGNANQDANQNVNQNANQNANAFVEDDEPATEPETVEESTEEPLPDGAFYVFLERNNGQRRLKTVMMGEGYLPEPEIPMRKGYVFEGWYSDSKFKKPFNFLKDKAEKQMTIYAKWSTGEKTVAYDIVIADCVGGTVEVNPQKASFGEPVSITVVPDEGKRLVQGSLKINGEVTDFFSFVMPKGKVTISAEFEDIPASENGDNQKSKLPLIIIVGVIIAVVVAVAIVVLKPRLDFNADLDPDEEIEEEVEEKVWIDESIVVGEGFKEGEKIASDIVPDYGELDSEEFDFE